MADRPRQLPVIERGGARQPPRLAATSREIDRAWRPVYAVWELTLSCDLACLHCGSRGGRARSDELRPSESRELVRQLADLGVREVTLIGGEAYLYETWLDVIRAIRESGMTCTMTTGGRGVTAERAALAAGAGLQGAAVSIDGDESVHDRLRGARGSRIAALAAMAELRRAGVPVSVNTQINALNMRQLPALLETIAEHGARSWQLQLTVPIGRAADQPEMLLQPFDLLEVFPALGLIAERAGELGLHIWPGDNIGYFGPYESVLRDSLPDGHGTGCSAGRATVGIQSDGCIKGCASLSSDWLGGSIRDASLRDIWERTAALRYTRDRTVADLWGWCRECYYADACMAGCTFTSSSLFGRAGNNPYCHHRALEHERRGLRERLLREQAPGESPGSGYFELSVEDVT